MSIDDALVERMVRLVRRMSTDAREMARRDEVVEQAVSDFEEARAIVALLPDPDLEAAKAWATSPYTAKEKAFSDAHLEGYGVPTKIGISGFLAGVKHARESLRTAEGKR